MQTQLSKRLLPAHYSALINEWERDWLYTYAVVVRTRTRTSDTIEIVIAALRSRSAYLSFLIQYLTIDVFYDTIKA